MILGYSGVEDGPPNWVVYSTHALLVLYENLKVAKLCRLLTQVKFCCFPYLGWEVFLSNLFLSNENNLSRFKSKLGHCLVMFVYKPDVMTGTCTIFRNFFAIVSRFFFKYCDSIDSFCKANFFLETSLTDMIFMILLPGKSVIKVLICLFLGSYFYADIIFTKSS